MNNNTKKNSEKITPKKIKEDSFLGAVKSDHKLNKSRLQELWLKIKLIPKILKDNFGFILFIIYALGASIQILELSLIDLSYLRFFSVKQIASDGALVSFTLAIFILVGYAYYYFVTLKFRENNNSLYKEKSSTKDMSILKPLLALLIIAVYGYGFIVSTIEIDFYREHPIIALISLAVTVALLAHFIKYSKYATNEINLLEDTNKNKKFFVKFFLVCITFLSYIFIPIIIVKTLMIYSEILREPRNFENYNKVGLVILEQHKDLIDHKVLYFNDKYTFIELIREDPNKNTIEVYKTDAILFDETAIKIKQ